MANERSSSKEVSEMVKRDIETAIKNEVHIDVAVTPFIKSESTRKLILAGKEQDPEWD